MQSDLEALQNTRLFRNMPEDSLARLATFVRHRHLAGGELLFEQGAPGIAMFVLAEGELRVSLRTPNKPELTLALLQPGDVVGELALFDEGEERSATVSATEPSRLLYLNRSDFLSTIESEPSALRAVLSSLADHIRTMNRRLNDMVTRDPNARLAKLLLEDLADYHSIDEESGAITITRDFSLLELGSMAYMHPVHLETRIRDLMYEHIVDRDVEGHLVVVNPDTMRGWLAS